MRTRLRQSFTIVRQFGICFIASAAFGISGCRDSTGPDDTLPGLTIRTDVETIHFEPSGSRNSITVPITLTNNSDKTLSLGFCSESLEQFRGLGWTTVFAPVCSAANVHVLPPIPPGTSLTFSFTAFDTQPPNPGFRFTDSSNVYRVRLGLWIMDGQEGEPVPPGADVTNPFNVEP
jgi:hypothetical protein